MPVILIKVLQTEATWVSANGTGTDAVFKSRELIAGFAAGTEHRKAGLRCPAFDPTSSLNYNQPREHSGCQKQCLHIFAGWLQLVLWVSHLTGLVGVCSAAWRSTSTALFLAWLFFLACICRLCQRPYWACLRVCVCQRERERVDSNAKTSLQGQE